MSRPDRIIRAVDAYRRNCAGQVRGISVIFKQEMIMDRQISSHQNKNGFQENGGAGLPGFMTSQIAGAFPGYMPGRFDATACDGQCEEFNEADLPYDSADIDERTLQFLANRRG
jgi:hypothetical protein